LWEVIVFKETSKYGIILARLVIL